MKKTNSKQLNKLLNNQRFIVELCNYSKNDIDTVIKNLSKVIGYFLNNPDANYNNIEELFKQIDKHPEIGSYHIIPVNGDSLKSIRVLGLNPNNYYNDVDLLTLNQYLSYTPRTEDLIVYNNITEAINGAFSTPGVLYNQILKQPKGKERPLQVGELERDYYESVMQTRLTNSKYSNDKRVKKLAKKVLDKYLDKGAALCFINEDRVVSTIKQNDFLLITLPSKHHLINTCAMNQDLRIGAKYPISEKKPSKEPPKYSSLHYTRIEAIPIDDTFNYTNEELTGDISYDIDTIYGKLDVKGSKEKISSSPDENIASIKELNDINLTRRNGSYAINHGRHRLLYIKNYFERNREYYSSRGKLKQLREYLTIPVNVDITIEDRNIQDLLISLERIKPSVKFLKVDITNDLPELVIIEHGNAYHVASEKDILELSKFLLNNTINNKFFIGRLTKHRVDYRELMNHLIATLKEKLFNMNFLDLVRYLKTNGFTIKGQEYDGSEIDFFTLHAWYTDINHRVTLDRLHNVEPSILKNAEAEELATKTAALLTRIFMKNPKLVLLDSTAILNYLKTKEEFANYPDIYLKRCIENNDYRNKSIYEMLKSSYEEQKKKK